MTSFSTVVTAFDFGMQAAQLRFISFAKPSNLSSQALIAFVDKVKAYVATFVTREHKSMASRKTWPNSLGCEGKPKSRKANKNPASHTESGVCE